MPIHNPKLVIVAPDDSFEVRISAPFSAYGYINSPVKKIGDTKYGEVTGSLVQEEMASPPTIAGTQVFLQRDDVTAGKDSFGNFWQIRFPAPSDNGFSTTGGEAKLIVKSALGVDYVRVRLK